MKALHSQDSKVKLSKRTQTNQRHEKGRPQKADGDDSELVQAQNNDDQVTGKMGLQDQFAPFETSFTSSVY